MGLWLLAALLVVVLFVAAMQHKKNDLCKGTKININTNHLNSFITEKEVDDIVNASNTVTELSIKNISIANIETAIKRNAWVKNAEVYFDNSDVLNIDIEQRNPIARVFTVNETSSYIDENGFRLPTKNNATARVLVITNFPSGNATLAQADSMMLQNVTALSNYIYTDSFLNAQIAQVNITTNGNFELVPTIGNQIIKIGNATNLKEKFDRLITFYKKAWLQNGMETYSIIDVRFNNQVVATKKGNWDIVVAKDSAAIMNEHVIDSVLH